MNTIISIKNISVKYEKTDALHNISCEIEKGDFIGLVGPNGAGKTTLAKTILGLTKPYSGEISFLSKTKTKYFPSIGYLPQTNNTINPLFPACVQDVVLLGLLQKKKNPKTIIKNDIIQMEKILDLLQINFLKQKNLSDLSGGQQQKVFLARALISDPEILILDEPSTALDPNSREDFFSIIQKINKESQTTIILITHDTGYVGRYANKLLYIDHKLIFFGEISTFCSSHDMHSCFSRREDHLIWHQHN